MRAPQPVAAHLIEDGARRACYEITMIVVPRHRLDAGVREERGGDGQVGVERADRRVVVPMRGTLRRRAARIASHPAPRKVCVCTTSGRKRAISRQRVPVGSSRRDWRVELGTGSEKRRRTRTLSPRSISPAGRFATAWSWRPARGAQTRTSWPRMPSSRLIAITNPGCPELGIKAVGEDEDPHGAATRGFVRAGSGAARGAARRADQHEHRCRCDPEIGADARVGRTRGVAECEEGGRFWQGAEQVVPKELAAAGCAPPPRR